MSGEKFRNDIIYQSHVDLPSLSAPKPYETVWFSIAISDLLLNYNNLVLKDLKKYATQKHLKEHINQYSSIASSQLKFYDIDLIS